jgi:hypothetical protein
VTPRYTPAAGGTSRTADRAYAATATSFFPPGPEKGLRIPFTKLPLTDPVTYFFDALSRADALYPFIGLCQVLAAVLIATPRTATLGALVHLPAITGIVVIPTTMRFPLTPVITCLMQARSAAGSSGCSERTAWPDHARLR